MSTDSDPSRVIPEGFKPHTESSTTILVPKGNTAFLNPVQQYNRDLSIAVIRAWNELRKEEAEARHAKKMQRLEGKGKKNKKGKQHHKAGEEGEAGKEEEGAEEVREVKNDQPKAGPSKPVGHVGRTRRNALVIR